MLIEIVLGLAALSGDVNVCPQHRQRLDAIAQALERRPGEAMLFYWEAATWADCGQLESSLSALARTREAASGFLPVRAVGFEKVWDEPRFQRVYEEFESALPRIGERATVAYTVRGADLIPEGIAYDEPGGALYIGSIAKGELIRVRGDRQEVIADRRAGLVNVLGLAVDAPARRLYAVNTNALSPPADGSLRNEVLVFDLDKGALLGRLMASDAGQLNDVAVGASGYVYASDSRNGAVYQCPRDVDGEFKVLVAPGSLSGANGLAVAENGALFVAHTTGVSRVDVKTGAVTPLANSTRETVGAIDGLYWRDGALLGIQNATNPGRVIQIGLDESLTNIAEVRTLLSHHHPALNEPTTGALAGDRLLVLANSYVAVLDETGKIRDRSVPRDPVVLAIDLAKAQ